MRAGIPRLTLETGTPARSDNIRLLFVRRFPQRASVRVRRHGNGRTIIYGPRRVVNHPIRRRRRKGPGKTYRRRPVKREFAARNPI